MVRSGGTWSMGDLAKRTGVHLETIRYYERIGLVPSPPRTAGGHRLYEEGDARRLIFIRRSRELGFTLDEVRSLLQLVDGGADCGEVKAMTLDHLERIRARIKDLQQMEQTLATTAARCEGGSAPECPVVDALFGT